MSRPAVRPGLVLLFALTIGPAFAADKPAAPAASPDQGVVDFLADWQDDSGQWVDPMMFARIDPAKIKAEDDKRRGKTPLPAPVSRPAPAAASGAVKAAR
jgi:hypothetical protein